MNIGDLRSALVFSASMILVAPLMAHPVSFNAPATVAYFGPVLQSVTAIDLNGDGKPDVVYGSLGDLQVLLGKGDGTFQTLPHVFDPNFNGGNIAVADFNGDGKPDLALPARRGRRNTAG